MAKATMMAALGVIGFATLALAPMASAASILVTSGAKTGDYTMTVQVGDFRLVPVQSSPQNQPGEGHIHYLLNGAPCKDACAGGASYATPSTTFTFRGLKAGDEVAAELVNNDHSSLSPRVLQAQKVGNSAPGFEPVLLVAGLGAALLAIRRRA